MTDDQAPELPAGLEAELGWLLGQAWHGYLTASQAVLADLPAGPRGHLVLAAAVHGSARNQIELARQLGLDRTVMVYLVDDLVRAGLVERRADPADRRNRTVVATELGRRRLAGATAALAAAEAHLLGALDPEEQRTLRTLLRRVVARQLADRDDPEAVRSMCVLAQELKDAAG
ncbi:MarR family winged helix-turn-helix transcriptional regulator [Streptomyces sp. NPDC092296]|uniref:MarR family winged helix-turn-helix transcriptional regulator n=1 Tax=Streptomyces sp. NPDC092296 TaxID=3366012 RepID=UPI0037F379D5